MQSIVKWFFCADDNSFNLLKITKNWKEGSTATIVNCRILQHFSLNSLNSLGLNHLDSSDLIHRDIFARICNRIGGPGVRCRKPR